MSLPHVKTVYQPMKFWFCTDVSFALALPCYVAHELMENEQVDNVPVEVPTITTIMECFQSSRW